MKFQDKKEFQDGFEKEIDNITDSVIKSAYSKFKNKMKVERCEYNNECSLLKYACTYSSSLPFVKYCADKFIKYASEETNDRPSLHINDESWWYDSFGLGPEPIELSINGAGTLDILKYLVEKGFSKRNSVRFAVAREKLDILKYLVEEQGEEIYWGFDEEGGNPYIDTFNKEIKAYLKKRGKLTGITDKEFAEYDILS
jgi:hypothetical protein